MRVAKLFFLLSGEHEDLPFSELKAILEAEGFDYHVSERLEQVARIEAETSCVDAVMKRAALTRLCGLELFTCRANMADVVRAMHSVGSTSILKNWESFAIRVKRVREHSRNIDTMILERKLGRLMLISSGSAKVKLNKPDKTFIGILTGGKLVFGIALAEILAKPFVERRPKRRPFFHPSAMQAKLARCMVNLARPKTGELVVDPFCGTGTMLTEAALVGCRVVGIDIQRRMAKGTVRNLKHFGLTAEGVIAGDVRHLPIRSVDYVVTDPPYGISSTTVRRSTQQLVEELLNSVYDLLKSGRRLCLASPERLKIESVGLRLGYKHLESHFVYVHRSLTRQITVLEKE